MRKADVLAYVHKQAAYLSARDISVAFHEPVAHAGAVLLRLHRQGLVQRIFTADGRVYSAISQRGVERLAWWRARDQQRAQQEKEEQEGTGFVKLFPGPSPGGQQLEDDGEDEPDETAAVPSLARFFPPRPS